MKLTKNAHCYTVYLYHSASARVEGVKLIISAVLIGSFKGHVLSAYSVKNILDDTLQTEEIKASCGIINAYTKSFRLYRQNLSLNGDILIAKLKNTALGVSVIAVACKHLADRRDYSCSHNACVLAERVGYGNAVPELRILRQTYLVVILW